MAIRIRLQPVEIAMDPVPGDKKHKFKVVPRLTIKFETGGKGANPSNTTPVPAKIELFEVPKKKDQSQSDRLIATIEGDFHMDGTTPKMDFKLNKMVRPGIVDDSDFRVALAWDPAHFANTVLAETLLLPWEVSEEQNVLEVGAALTIDGTLHADTKVNDRADLPLQHNHVPRDGNSTAEFATYFGLGAVYSPASEHFKAGQRLPLGSSTLHVFLHESVRRRCEQMTPGSFDLAGLSANLQTIMASGGFSTVAVEEKTTAQATAATAPWAAVPSAGPVVARNVTDPLALGPDDGVDIPFFDFWVFYDSPPIHGGETGQSEMLNPNGPIDRAARTKRVISPIALVSGSGSGTFDSVYPQVAKDDAMVFLANLIGHEIGHTFGLEHGLTFDPGSKSYDLVNGTFEGIMTTAHIAGGNVSLKKWGPVHRNALKAHFL